MSQAGRNCVIVKRDIKSAFRNVPIAITQQWALGFTLDGQFFKEACLPCGLRTAPFIFNLFAEALHWVLETHTSWKSLIHYLDDFIGIFPASKANTSTVKRMFDEYVFRVEKLGIPQNISKNVHGTVVPVLGIEIDTDKMEARLPK